MTGPSMLPTLANEGELVFESRWSYRMYPDSLRRGDLITFRSPLDRNRIVCKRVIGFPGDIICVDPTGQKAPSTEHVEVPKGHVWVMGDNAPISRDSRDYGPISMGLIQGTLFARVKFLTYVPFHAYHKASKIWPPSKFTIFRNPTTYLDHYS
ncbi:peptidase S24/S26A/S26B/S26C [Mycena haematopus]|nr:peptidase S24/S26A/S26B/S26C [Mycena haematopus]